MLQKHIYEARQHSKTCTLQKFLFSWFKFNFDNTIYLLTSPPTLKSHFPTPFLPHSFIRNTSCVIFYVSYHLKKKQICFHVSLWAFVFLAEKLMQSHLKFTLIKEIRRKEGIPPESQDLPFFSKQTKEKTKTFSE